MSPCTLLSLPHHLYVCAVLNVEIAADKRDSLRDFQKKNGRKTEPQ